jgi:hypothetical protein
MNPIPASLGAALRDGVATVDATGAVSAPTIAMQELLALLGGGRGPVANLRDLGLSADELAVLHAGDDVGLDVGGRRWRARLCGTGGERWLVATEVTAEVRTASALAELARLRSLGAAAATLVHDLANHMNSCLGLASQVQESVSDPVEVEILGALTSGAQQGAALARTLARMLARGAGERAVVPASQLLDEALTLVAKAASQRGVAVTHGVSGDVPVVRTVVVEAVQALWQTLIAIADRMPKRVDVTLAAVDTALAAGRVRRSARVRIVATGLTRDAATELGRVVDGAPGFLSLVARTPTASGLAAAVFVLRRLGGDLLAHCGADGGLQIDWLLPARA